MQPLIRRLDALWQAVVRLLLTVLSLGLFVVSAVALPLSVLWVGIPVTFAAGRITRVLAGLRRREVGRRLHREIDPPYLRISGHYLPQFLAFVRDPAFRRDLAWLFVDGTLGLALSIVAVFEGVLDLLFWWLPVGLAGRLHDRVDAALLSTSQRSRLALRVEQLTESRAETRDTGAAELRRIERDLHDGAQARLVSLGMSLALAEEQLTRDPARAAALLAEARTASSTALAELRDLVRGIHPPVLADRGLAGAIEALTLACPHPVALHLELGSERLAAPVESAAYFTVAEAVTNVVKHAAASRIEVSLVRVDDRLEIGVTDDGVGGADESRGTGLRGIARRLSAFDGTLAITSPPGGPTRLVMVLPCASSSPRTLPSSGTG